MTEKKQCPSCHGYGEIMTRDPYWDPAATPYPEMCRRCMGNGEVET